MPDEAAAERIKVALYNIQVQEFLALISKELQNPGVPVVVSISKLRSKLLEISDSCIPSKILFRKANKKHNSHRPSPWFDNDCKQEKKLLNKARKMYQFALKNDLNGKKESLRNSYFSQRGKYHRTIKSKRKIYNEKRKEKLWNLKSCSPKEFWRTLGSSNKSNNMDFDKTTLFEYFSNLLNTRESHTVVSEHEVSEEEFQTDENLSRLINDTLNCKITLDEVKTMIDKLKTGKASGIDLITAELLKGLNELFLTVFTQLFNKIDDSGDFPEEWAVRIIVLMFKGGDKSNLDNHRGITLLSIFGNCS